MRKVVLQSTSPLLLSGCINAPDAGLFDACTRVQTTVPLTAAVAVNPDAKSFRSGTVSVLVLLFAVSGPLDARIIRRK
jgi:hypothetical protein